MNRIPAISVNQPIGQFFLCSIPYTLVQQVAIPEALTLSDAGEHISGLYRLTGSQREEVKERRTSIGNYIQSVEATFPNTIILAANVNEDGSILDDDDPNKWLVEYDERCKLHFIVVPTDKPIARIIDGQHRVRGFDYTSKKPHLFDLPCAVFLDLSMPEQASIFATININQRKVDRSLAFNLFAYNLNDEPETAWAPDKLAVFFTRRLSVENQSPLKGHIKVIARQGSSVYSNDDWYVSTSAVVDGITALFSKRPSNDRNELNKYQGADRNRKQVLGNIQDDTPLRIYYLECNDVLIYTLIFNFFLSVDAHILSSAERRGFMTKTIGIQALFDFLKELAYIAIERKDISKSFFDSYLQKFSKVDFNRIEFPANNQGRNRIRNLLLYTHDLMGAKRINDADKQLYDTLLS